ncbi:LamG domain-containing protein, partial [Salmonella enterica subsp. houtenae]|nr:LamG domain-containing protein [Salmonella enterica subsp. houtenae]
KKTLTGYYSLDGVSIASVSVDYSSGGDYVLPNTTWGFNGNKGNAHYASYPDHECVMNFDNIIIWDKCLTEDDVKAALVTELPDNSDGTLLHYYPMEKNTPETIVNTAITNNINNLSDARMDKINRMVRLQRWLNLPYDQVDLLLSSVKAVSSVDTKNGSPFFLSNINAMRSEFNGGVLVDAARNAEVYINDDISNDGKKITDFTLVFWCKINDSVQDLSLITTNKIGKYAGSNVGITLFAKEKDDKFIFYPTISDGSTELKVGDDINIEIITNQWTMVALQQNSASKVLSDYICTDGENLQTFNIDFSEIGSTLLTNTYWGFNSNKGNQYYNNYKDRRCVIGFDDVTLWNRVLNESEVKKFVTSGIPAAGYSGMKHYYPLDSTIVSNNTLRMLSVYEHYQQSRGVGALPFAAILSQITPYAIAPAIPLFDQIFNTPSLYEEPLAITNDPFDYTALTGDDGRIVKQICAGLGIDRAQFVLLAQQVSKAQGDGSTSLNCSLDVVSAFYRLVMVPRWLGLNFSDGMALLELVEAGQAMGKLAGIPVYAALDTQGQPTDSDLLDTLMALADTATWLADNNLSALKILALLQSGEGNMPATTAELNFITEINQQLPAVLLNEQSFTGVPVPENTNILEFPAGYSSITGVVTNDAVQLNSKDGQYAMLDDEANTKVTGSNDYTLGGWAYIDSASEKTPLYATATIGADNTHTGAGISVTLGDGYNLVAIISDDTGKSITSSSTTGQANWGKNGAWFYFAVVMDTAAEILTLYAFTDSGTNVTSAILDYSSLTGSIGTPEGNTGSFNEDGSEQFYSTVSNMFLTVRYDNVCMWDSVLTESELTSIVQSGKPVLFSSWLDTFSDLIDDQGLVMPVAIDYSTVLSYVQADIAEYTFDDPDQVASMLATVIWQAKHSQDGIADSSLAKALKTDSNLSTFLLAWADASEYSLLSQTLALSTITQAADIPDSYSQMLYQVARRAGICTTVGLTPAMMFTFLSNPAWFGVTDTSIDFNLMYLFSRYADWLKLTPKEDDVLAYLSWVNSDSLPPVTEASEALAALLNWDSDQVEQAAAHANETDGIARNLSQVDTVMRLQTLCTNT